MTGVRMLFSDADRVKVFAHSSSITSNRLSVIPIHVPSLEERIEDIPILTLHFIELITQEMGIAKKEIEPNAVKELQQKPWPGNIRQFRNVIERLIILSAQSITLNDVKQFA